LYKQLRILNNEKAVDIYAAATPQSKRARPENPPNKVGNINTANIK
jgi:hypothetical protein